MRYIFLFLFLLNQHALTLFAGNNSFRSDPSKTFVFVAGVLKWQDPSLAAFSDRNRKDEELFRLLESTGIPAANMIFLKDKAATLTNIKTRLQELLLQTRAGATFIFYYAGHGIRAGNGPVCFANYDYKDGNGFSATIVSSLINQYFKGDEVWLLADCCFSGALLDEAKTISGNGRKVVAFTSATSSNISTGNWTFTQTMIDCFSGLARADRDKNKSISLAEVKTELFDAMLYREKQMAGAAFINIKENTAIQLQPVSDTYNNSGTRYVYTLREGKFEPARVLTIQGNTLRLELYHYSDKETITTSVSNTKPIEYMVYPAGTSVMVEWKGKYYPAMIKKVQNGVHYIQYTGYDDSWNEWVMYDRISTRDRKPCQVEWQGQWYPAEILQEKNGRYFIHYTGYGNDWDEWAPAVRVKQ
ncbi:MAG: caspase family protein [Bacteroidetes bacterium]|nr:caspase family protein [Bacteroidota bacterium]